MTEEEIREITNLALEAFWERVAKSIPQATTGDLSPTISGALEQAATNAVREWWNNNCPDLI